MENKPLVSVIIPCYNLGKYIDEAVDSVLAQTYQNFEIIIINDGSTDEYTNRLLKNYNKSKTKVFWQENKGVSVARNYGIAQSKGEYILPLDADDKIKPLFLEKAMMNIQNNDIIYSRIQLFGAKKGELTLPEYSEKELLKQNLIVNTALYPKRFWELVDGYDENMTKGWEDWDFWLMLIEKGARIKKIEEILFCYRVLHNSRNRSFNKREKQELEQYILEKHIELYKKYFPEPLTLLRELDHLREEKENFERYKQEIYNSASYKLGFFLLKPFKIIKKVLKNQ